ncbi:sensor histidine kinase [Pseudoduganella violacea]|uniref:Oxygen sensor histidine kinase NreB n=1 Tax=Pseudoduganella violacea TaxID=1715466 RepID=A0A7W5BFB5_9BURK|nr:sensor histidine kinase [Pseudoduganella violacea]MBB3122083.1 signal transduction histidine kinase [Pseudoduganella violacea]
MPALLPPSPNAAINLPLFWPPAMQIEVLALCAMLLSLLVLTLLWRLRRQQHTLHGLQAQLTASHKHQDESERRLLEAHQQLCALAAKQDHVCHGERLRIARDIHDDLGQYMLALQLEICVLRRNPQLPDWMAQGLLMLEEHLGLALRSLRAILNNLRPTALQHGLRRAIQQQAREFTRTCGIPCKLEAFEDARAEAGSGDPGRAEAEAALYRMLQEALSNVARHACASEVCIALASSPTLLSLSVRDNGVGLPHQSRRRGYGLPGLAERLQAAGGQLTLESKPGQGTTLLAAIPIVSQRKDIAPDQSEICD